MEIRSEYLATNKSNDDGVCVIIKLYIALLS